MRCLGWSLRRGLSMDFFGGLRLTVEVCWQFGICVRVRFGLRISIHGSVLVSVLSLVDISDLDDRVGMGIIA